MAGDKLSRFLRVPCHFSTTTTFSLESRQHPPASPCELGGDLSSSYKCYGCEGRCEQNRRASVEALIVGSAPCTFTTLMTMPRSTLVSFIIICYALSLSPVLVQSREADDRSQFLYADDPRAVDILEYQLHNAPTKDYAVEGQNMGIEYDEERHIRPYFLNNENGRRVVQYYSPWCG